MALPMNKWLLKELECPVCLTYMAPPILQCETGHNICCQCRSKLHNCPLCKGKFTEVRNFSLEGLSNKIKVPCKNKSAGCTATILICEREEHESNCKFVLFKCAYPKCPWVGKYEDIMAHWMQKKGISKPYGQMRVCHTKLQKEEMWYVSLIVAHGELFWYRFMLKQQKLYWCVQLIGPDEKADDYYFEIEMFKVGQTVRRVLLANLCQPERTEPFLDDYCVSIPVNNINHLIGDDQMLIYYMRVFVNPSKSDDASGTTQTHGSKNRYKKTFNKAKFVQNPQFGSQPNLSKRS